MGKADDYNYGVVLDAGSSGTRAYVYRWQKNAGARKGATATQLKTLPEVITKDKWTKKVHPGVSTFGEKPEQVWDDHLEELIEHALDHIPKKAVPNTPIFVLATAGMRLLPENQRETLLTTICNSLKSETKFLLPNCSQHVQVIPGDTEGLFGWIAANYLLGGFNATDEHDHGQGHHTYGFLDMGGASAQIAFAPNATEADKHANDLKLVRLRNIDGTPQEYKVFVTTWLGFGVNEARRRYVEAMRETFGIEEAIEMPDPCLPAGILLSITGEIVDEVSPNEPRLIGTGQFDECLRQTLPLLEKDKECVDEPCLINGVHVPGIDFDVNHFVGISEYWHTTHEIFEMGHKDKAYDFNTYQHRVKEFCEQNWSDIEDGIQREQWGKKVNAKTAYEVCFKASWLINVLHDGIGVPRVGIEGISNEHNGTKEVLDAGREKGYLDSFQAVNKINDVEVSWTMGKMLLYASADVPAISTDAAPVGYGSNEVGVTIPSDFQYPGGGRLQGVGSPDGTSFTDKLSSSIFRSDTSHRLPGFIFFLLILVIASFYLCGRERRSRLYTTYFYNHNNNKPSTTSSSNLTGLVGKILGRKRKPMMDYERGLGEDDGSTNRLYDPSDFELGDMNDYDSSDDGNPNANPNTMSMNKQKKTPRPPTRLAGRMTPDILDRRGFVVRTESREKLGELGGRKSRSGSGSPKNTSPTRFRMPLS